MSEAPSVGPNTHHWPPMLYVVAMALALWLGWLWPWRFTFGALQAWLGGAIFMLGLLSGALGIWQFQKIGTTVSPTGQARVLAARGIYRFSRNPMYLGAMLAYLGLGLWFGQGWLVLVALAMAPALYLLAIRREEAWLKARFGAEYEAYCARVRRWI